MEDGQFSGSAIGGHCGVEQLAHEMQAFRRKEQTFSREETLRTFDNIHETFEARITSDPTFDQALKYGSLWAMVSMR